ncbi:hypothetical protein WMY93_015646 [Mugilogobius chulae]|uniref:Uncharacterized protein n=1 Tax=Mugilogobius chulae TaxID=88201 RepID=A0AAW0P0T6_9GOBI
MPSVVLIPGQPCSPPVTVLSEHVLMCVVSCAEGHRETLSLTQTRSIGQTGTEAPEDITHHEKNRPNSQLSQEGAGVGVFLIIAPLDITHHEKNRPNSQLSQEGAGVGVFLIIAPLDITHHEKNRPNSQLSQGGAGVDPLDITRHEKNRLNSQLSQEGAGAGVFLIIAPLDITHHDKNRPNSQLSQEGAGAGVFLIIAPLAWEPLEISNRRDHSSNLPPYDVTQHSRLCIPFNLR